MAAEVHWAQQREAPLEEAALAQRLPVALEASAALPELLRLAPLAPVEALEPAAGASAAGR